MSRTTRGRGTMHTLDRGIDATVQVVRGISGLTGFVWRHRIGLGPLLAGVGVLLSGCLSVWFIKTPLYVYGTYVLSALLIMIGIKFGITDREGKLHARRDRVHMYVVTAAALAWDIIFYRYVYTGVVSFKTSLIMLAWMVGILGAPWWWNLRRRSRVTLENNLDAWPAVARGTSLAGTYWSGFKKTTDGWEGFLNIPGAMSRRQVLESAELIEGLTNAPTDSVTVEPSGRNPNKVHVTCVSNDPFTDAIMWDGRVLRSITEVALLGRYSDRSEEKTVWFEPGVGGFHRLMGGITRSGKSGLMHLLAALYGPCDDVVLWCIDLKGGTTLLPWAPLADWTATTIDEAMVMMQAAAEFVDARAAAVAKMGKQVAPISRQMPALIIMCDEIASLIGDSAPVAVSRRAGSAMVEVARKGSAMGVLMVLATQYPTLAALKDSQLKSQLGWRACFRLGEPNQGRFILPSMPRGVDPYRISKDRKGTCYIDDQGQFRHTTLRVVYIRDEEIRPIVDEYWQTTPALDAASLAWRNPELVAVYKKRRIWTPDMLDRMMAGETIDGRTTEDLYNDVEDTNFDGEVNEEDVKFEQNDGIEAAVQSYLDADAERAVDEEDRRQRWLASRAMKPEGEARRLLYDALAGAPIDGMSPGQLARICGRRERTIHRWLEEDKASGKVIRVDYGRYVLASGTSAMAKS